MHHITAQADTPRYYGTKVSAVLILQHVADRRIHLGNGASVIAVSRKKAAQLRLTGFASGFVDKLERLSLVIAAETGEVITVLKGALSPAYRPGGCRPRRRGRRQWQRRS